MASTYYIARTTKGCLSYRSLHIIHPWRTHDIKGGRDGGQGEGYPVVLNLYEKASANERFFKGAELPWTYESFTQSETILMAGELTAGGSWFFPFERS